MSQCVHMVLVLTQGSWLCPIKKLSVFVAIKPSWNVKCRKSSGFIFLNIKENFVNFQGHTYTVQCAHNVFSQYFKNNWLKSCLHDKKTTKQKPMQKLCNFGWISLYKRYLLLKDIYCLKVEFTEIQYTYSLLSKTKSKFL